MQANRIKMIRDSMSPQQLYQVEELLIERFGATTFQAIGEEETLRLHNDVLSDEEYDEGSQIPDFLDNAAGS